MRPDRNQRVQVRDVQDRSAFPVFVPRLPSARPPDASKFLCTTCVLRVPGGLEGARSGIFLGVPYVRERFGEGGRRA